MSGFEVNIEQMNSSESESRRGRHQFAEAKLKCDIMPLLHSYSMRSWFCVTLYSSNTQHTHTLCLSLSLVCNRFSSCAYIFRLRSIWNVGRFATQHQNRWINKFLCRAARTHTRLNYVNENSDGIFGSFWLPHNTIIRPFARNKLANELAHLVRVRGGPRCTECAIYLLVPMFVWRWISLILSLSVYAPNLIK